MNLRKVFPQGVVPLVTKDGYPTRAYQRFFAQQTFQPGNIAAVVVGASPYAYQANESGSLSVKGGTVSVISITRAAVVFVTGLTSGIIPVSLGDTITVTYTVLPTLTFIPN